MLCCVYGITHCISLQWFPIKYSQSVLFYSSRLWPNAGFATFTESLCQCHSLGAAGDKYRMNLTVMGHEQWNILIERTAPIFTVFKAKTQLSNHLNFPAAASSINPPTDLDPQTRRESKPSSHVSLSLGEMNSELEVLYHCMTNIHVLKHSTCRNSQRKTSSERIICCFCLKLKNFFASCNFN